MKIKNLEFLLLIFILSSTSNTSFSQTNSKKHNDLDIDGSWLYKNENIEFITRITKVNIMASGLDKEYILGFSKLTVDNNVVYDNLNNISLFNHNGYLKIEDLNRLLRDKINPEIMINTETMHGSYFAYNHSKKLSLKLSFEDDMIILYFSNLVNIEFPNLLNGEGVNSKPEPDQIPAVPSTWVLKRVEN